MIGNGSVVLYRREFINVTCTSLLYIILYWCGYNSMLIWILLFGWDGKQFNRFHIRVWRYQRGNQSVYRRIILLCLGIFEYIVCYYKKLWFLVFYRHIQHYFSYIMAISFSGAGSWSTWREPPTMGKQLVNFSLAVASRLHHVL